MDIIPTHYRRLALATLTSIALALVLSGCVYRINIQQGNFLEPKDIDRVAVGMTRPQVRSLLGTPMVADPFQTSRWDYVYYLKHGKLRRTEQRHFIVFFEGDTVARIERKGDTVRGGPPQTDVAQSDAIKREVIRGETASPADSG